MKLAARESLLWAPDRVQSLQVLMEGNNTRTLDDLLDSLIERCSPCGGTDFDEAIRTACNLLERQWDAQRYIQSLYTEQKPITPLLSQYSGHHIESEDLG